MNKIVMRGIVGKDLNKSAIKLFAKKIVSYIYENKLKPNIIVGKDNRVSSDYILNEINSVLLSCGINVNLLEISTTPEIAFLIKKFKFSLGVMITASHNLAEYNGFKCFNNLGENVDLSNVKIFKKGKIKFGKVIYFDKFKQMYIWELKNALKPNNIRCVFDCANGATVDVIRKVFPHFSMIGGDSCGLNINKECGAQDLNKIKSICKRNGKIGFAFDGDGDRVVAIAENGEIIDGDKILYILATQMLNIGDKIVGTQTSSVGLEVSLRRLGVTLIREKVGAKYVSKRLKSENLILGGETCGHIFLSNKVSDGVRTAIELLNILNRTGLNFKQLLAGYKQTYCLNKNLSLENSKNIKEFESVSKTIRIVVRKSETEKVLRVFVEGDDEFEVKQKFDGLIKQLKEGDCEVG